MTIRTAHLCAGYDGLGLALDIVHPGHVPQWFAEVDPDVSQVLKREHPGVPNVGDIKTVPWELSPHVDLLTSGDPCQSISIAGRQAGRSDPRFLWPWVRQAIAALRPYRVFLENVQNMVSHDGGRTLRERLDDLRALGYASRWTVLGACAVGAPHHRHRWFLVADLVERGPAPEAVRVDAKAVCGAPRAGGRLLLPTPLAADRECNPGWSPTSQSRSVNLRTAVSMLPTPAARDGGDRGTPSREHALRRLADPSRSNNLEDVIAALLPTPLARDAEGRGEGTRAYWDERGKAMPLGAAATLLPTPLAGDADKGQNSIGSTGGYSLAAAANPAVWGKYADAVALWESVTGVPAPPATEPNTSGKGRRLSPLLPEWMMGLPPGYLTADLARSAAIRAAGNGVVPLQAAAAYRRLT